LSKGRIIVKSEKLREKAVMPYWNLETGDREPRKLSFGIDELRVDFHSLLSPEHSVGVTIIGLRPYVVFIA